MNLQPQNDQDSSDDSRPLQVPARQPNAAPGQAEAANVARHQVNKIYDDQNPYHRTHQENFDWQRYHSAWQQYYQQYYQKYYHEQLHSERERIAAQPPVSDGVVAGADPTGVQRTEIQKLKAGLVDKVKEQAHKAKRSHHFVPIISALAVGVVFLFMQFNSVLVAQTKSFVSPGAFHSDNIVVNDNSASEIVGKQSRLIIPKINEGMPVVYDVTALDDPTVQQALKRGVVHYKLPGANALPGQFGNTVILGHSSNDVFSAGDFKYVFLLLERMQPGDLFYLHYDGKRYVYKVTETKIIKPSDISALQIGSAKPMVTLVTCTPPGVNFNRFLVYGEQISPDPTTAAKPAEPTPQPAAAQTLPGNGPTLLEQVWDVFF